MSPTHSSSNKAIPTHSGSNAGCDGSARPCLNAHCVVVVVGALSLMVGGLSPLPPCVGTLANGAPTLSAEGLCPPPPLDALGGVAPQNGNTAINVVESLAQVVAP